MNCLRLLVTLRALVVFCLRCRARVAPLVDETEDEVYILDEFLPPEPPARRRGRGRARGRARGAGRHRQRDLQEDELAEQDYEEAEFVAEAP